MPIGVVSNAAGQIESVLRRVGVCQVGEGAGVPVRCVVDSHVVGVAKPDPRDLRLRARRAGLLRRARRLRRRLRRPSTSPGARAAGLQPVLLDPYDDHAGADHARIASLHDLLTWW